MDGPRTQRRKLRNTWLEPRLQLRYGMLGFAFVAVAVVGAQLLTFVAVRAEALRVLREARSPARLADVVDLAMRSALLENLWLYPILAAIALFGAARVLHRFVGPQVPIRRVLAQLRAGEYGGSCGIRDRDELHDLVAEINELSATLHERHGNGPTELARRRQAGFSLLEVLVIMATLAVITAIGVGQFLRAYDRARQRSTMADMRIVASANGVFYVDQAEYANQLDDLEPYYLQPVPRVDRWGYAWDYSSAGRTYQLASRGSDGIPGPAAPAPWEGAPFECDLVLTSGAFSQSPAI